MHGNTGFHYVELELFKVGDQVEIRDISSPFHQWSGTIKAVWPADALSTPHYRVDAAFVTEPRMSLYFSHSQLVEQDIPF